jgi:hypothetical protein
MSTKDATWKSEIGQIRTLLDNPKCVMDKRLTLAVFHGSVNVDMNGVQPMESVDLHHLVRGTLDGSQVVRAAIGHNIKHTVRVIG